MYIADVSSFVSDCGVPTMFLLPPNCDGCSICCNSLDDCYPQEDNDIQDAGFKDYDQFSWAFFLIIVVGCCGLLLVSFMYRKYKDGALFDPSDPQASDPTDLQVSNPSGTCISDPPQLQASEPSEAEG